MGLVVYPHPGPSYVIIIANLGAALLAEPCGSAIALGCLQHWTSVHGTEWCV
jgi:hypothetical protein